MTCLRIGTARCELSSGLLQCQLLPMDDLVGDDHWLLDLLQGPGAQQRAAAPGQLPPEGQPPSHRHEPPTAFRDSSSSSHDRTGKALSQERPTRSQSPALRHPELAGALLPSDCPLRLTRPPSLDVYSVPASEAGVGAARVSLVVSFTQCQQVHSVG